MIQAPTSQVRSAAVTIDGVSKAYEVRSGEDVLAL